MELARAKLVILDTSTLGNVARDFWSTDANLRHKAQAFISELKDRGGRF